MTLYFMPSPPGLDTKQTKVGKIFEVRHIRSSMYVAKMSERYNEPLKIRTDIRQGGSFLCDSTPPRGNVYVCET